MASPTSHHTVRSLADRVRHVLFPSRRQVVVTTVIDVTAMLIGVPLLPHVLVDVAVHVAFRVRRR
jgi:hypothetical protein